MTPRPLNDSSDGSSRSSTRAVPRQALLLGGVLVVGLLVGLLVARLLAGSSDDAAPPASPAAASEAPQLTFEAPGPPGDDVDTDPQSASSPEAAVAGFLALEAAKDYTASYGYLSEKDVATWRSAAEWELAHADLPGIEGFEIEDTTATDVTTQLALDSRLDQVTGLVPARGRGTWATTETDEGVRVVYADSTFQPVYPADDAVPEAAAAFVDAAAACEDEPPTYDGQLIGLPAFADELCEAGGDPQLGPAGVLTDGPDTSSLLNAFGPEVYTWARTVEVRAPVEFSVVLAPIDDRWQVIGLVRS